MVGQDTAAPGTPERPTAPAGPAGHRKRSTGWRIKCDQSPSPAGCVLIWIGHLGGCFKAIENHRTPPSPTPTHPKSRRLAGSISIPGQRGSMEPAPPAAGPAFPPRPLRSLQDRVSEEATFSREYCFQSVQVVIRLPPGTAAKSRSPCVQSALISIAPAPRLRKQLTPSRISAPGVSLQLREPALSEWNRLTPLKGRAESLGEVWN